MASVNWKKRGKRYLVYWRADDGSQGGKTVDTEDQAPLLTAQMLLELTSGTWAGPGGGNGVQAGTRTVLSRDNFRRVYHAALAKLADPAAIDLRPTARRVLAALRADGVATAEELTKRLGGQGRRLKLGTVQTAARELEAAGLAIVDGGEAARWKAQPPPGNDMLEELELHGPHDFRHTLSTWLEEAGIPARVIDETLGHQSGQTSRRSPRDSGSRVGTRYRHTTPEMAARVVAAIQERLAVVLEIAQKTKRSETIPPR